MARHKDRQHVPTQPYDANLKGTKRKNESPEKSEKSGSSKKKKKSRNTERDPPAENAGDLAENNLQYAHENGGRHRHPQPITLDQQQVVAAPEEPRRLDHDGDSNMNPRESGDEQEKSGSETPTPQPRKGKNADRSIHAPTSPGNNATRADQGRNAEQRPPAPVQEAGDIISLDYEGDEDEEMEDLNPFENEYRPRKPKEKSPEPPPRWRHYQQNDPAIEEWVKRTFYWKASLARNTLSGEAAKKLWEEEKAAKRIVKLAAVIGHRGTAAQELKVIRAAAEDMAETFGLKGIRVLLTPEQINRQRSIATRSPWILYSYDKEGSARIRNNKVRISTHPDFDGLCKGIVWRELPSEKKALYTITFVPEDQTPEPTAEALNALNGSQWAMERNFHVYEFVRSRDRENAIVAKIRKIDESVPVDNDGDFYEWPSGARTRVKRGKDHPNASPTFKPNLAITGCAICHSEDHQEKLTLDCPLKSLTHGRKRVSWKWVPDPKK
jgi:hypothetical protein